MMEGRNILRRNELYFSVFKASKYLFECKNAQSDSDDIKVSDYTSHVDEMAAMNLQQIHVMKRVDTIEVDKLIKSSTRAPPQCLLTYKEEKDADAFKSFCIYLQERQRAGIATLENDLLVALIPVRDSDKFLHCAIIQSKEKSPFQVPSSQQTYQCPYTTNESPLQCIHEEDLRRLSREAHTSFNAFMYEKLTEWSRETEGTVYK